MYDRELPLTDVYCFFFKFTHINQGGPCKKFNLIKTAMKYILEWNAHKL